MELGDTIISALIGALTAAIISLAGYWASYRNLRTEYLAKRNIDFTNKQIAACEALSVILEPVSRSQGDERVIIYKGQQAFVALCAAREFYKSLCKVFNSSAGLYYSKQLRNELFDLRNYLMEEFIAKAEEGQTELPIARNKAERLDGKVQQLRIAIRAEIGVEDLRVATVAPTK
jgi:hypothetical protein